MQDRILRYVETAANICIICLGIALCLLLVRRVTAPGARTQRADGLRAGQPLRGLDIQWQSNEGTLVLALSTQCKYCAESAPFYRRLTATAREQGIPVIALLPQEPTEARGYLQAKGIEVSGVHRSQSSIGISAFPTLMLVNRAGILDEFWVGKLGPDEERRVEVRLASLRKEVPH